MAHQKYFAGGIWTNHALERLGQRGLSQKMAGETFSRPDKQIDGKQPGTVEFQRKYGKSLVTVIAKKNDQREWIILSCWIDPPLPGSIDILKKQQYFAYQKASFWGKLWIIFKRQLGF